MIDKALKTYKCCKAFCIDVQVRQLQLGGRDECQGFINNVELFGEAVDDLTCRTQEDHGWAADIQDENTRLQGMAQNRQLWVSTTCR